MTDRYAVIGNPIHHSLSPRIHQQFARQTAQDIAYEALLIEPADFEQAFMALPRAGYRGVNVTLPFKTLAFEQVDRCSARAQQAGAVNTVIFSATGSFGDNTDGVGLVNDLTLNLGLSLHNRRVLILGAGGATRGVIAPLFAAGIAALHIANRSPDKALSLAKAFGDLGLISTGGLEALPKAVDLVINATSAALHGEPPPYDSHYWSDAFCYDMLYGADETAWVKKARAGGSEAADGLGMLVEQAAEAFSLWRGLRPKTQVVISDLRQSLRNAQG